MPRFNSTRTGFSLVELVMAMAVSSILVGAMAVALITASSALERGEGAFASDRATGDALADLQSDLAEATEFYERTSTSVWFSVPDRDGDDLPEHIRYSWSGKIGDSLTRSTNGGAPGVVLADVREFDLSFIARAGPTQTVSAERLIAGLTSHPGATEDTQTVSETAWNAQILRPSFTADAVSWKATRLRTKLRLKGAADSSVRFSIVAVASDGTPSGATYATTEIKESTLGSSLRTDEILFAACDPIPANQPVAIVARGVTAGADACDIGYLKTSSPTLPFNMWRSTSTNSGSTWQGYGQSQCTIFEIYGTVTTEAR